MIWTAYLIAIHLLSIPGAYLLLGLGLTAFLSSTTNILTGETLPWARGIGWAAAGAVVVGVAWVVFGATCKGDEPYDFYNPPPSYQVLEKPNATGEFHFVARGVVHDHMVVGQIADIWAKSQNEAQAIANKTVKFPGTIICANGQRLPIIALLVERVGEWRVGKPAPNEPDMPSRNRGDLAKEVLVRMQKPGWVLDYRDREDVRDKEEAKSFIWIDRLAKKPQ